MHVVADLSPHTVTSQFNLHFAPSANPFTHNRLPMANHPPSSLLPLLLLTTLLLASAGLTLGLTFAPCHSSLCVELRNPYQTRIHIAVFYSLLASLTLALTARVYLPALRRLSGTYISDRPLPLVGKRLTLGGVVLVLWIAAATFASIAYWLPAQYSYWYARGALVDWTPKALSRVAWTGITGHWCDIWVGLVILPVGRNSIIGRAFGVHTSALLFAHKVLAYTFFVGALIHGVTYYVSAVLFTSRCDERADDVTGLRRCLRISTGICAERICRRQSDGLCR